MSSTPSEATDDRRIHEGSESSSGARAEGRRLSNLDVVLNAVTIATVAASLAMRVIHRGEHYPGWDVVGVANGVHLVSTKSLGELFGFYVYHQWQPPFWNTTGILVALLPGWLASLWPWERWMHVITPCLAASSLWLTARALRLPGRALWMILLPLGASPALLSYAVMGLPYISNTLPYAVAFWVVFRWRDSVAGTAALMLLAIGLSWQVQELGRTAFVVFVAAALTLPAVPLRLRVVWLLGGAAWCWLTLAYPTFNTARHAGLAMASVVAWPQHAWDLGLHFAHSKPDHPTLLVAGLLAIFLVQRERWFWSALLATHAALIFILATSTGEIQGLTAVWPRRVLILSFVALAACAAALRAPRRPAARLLIGLLLAGNVWQVWMCARWASRPLDVTARAREWSYTLPFIHTPVHPGPEDIQTGLDSQVTALPLDWYAELRTELANGRKVLLFYNLLSFDENATNPAGIIDRLYVGLGPERFDDAVYVFGFDRRMVRELPIRRIGGFRNFVNSIDDPAQWRAYWLHHPNDDRDWPQAKRLREEVAFMFENLERRFRLEWAPSSRDRYGRTLHRFTIHARDDGT